MGRREKKLRKQNTESDVHNVQQKQTPSRNTSNIITLRVYKHPAETDRGGWGRQLES